ncbi:hypothetical protein [Streptomyces aureoversilis]|uniref:Transposase n=1 Tax=Streptomyces aureoversilis TaxID=67277 RepID=A0ABV9ZZC0_9ACTN
MAARPCVITPDIASTTIADATDYSFRTEVRRNRCTGFMHHLITDSRSG